MPSKMEKAAWADPLKVAGDVYTLLLENERVRVLETRFNPGQKAAMHGHPEHIVYGLSDYTIRITHPDGTSKEGAVMAGQTIWMHAGPHASENIGKTEAYALVIELKEPYGGVK